MTARLAERVAPDLLVAVQAEQCRRSFARFVREAWPLVEPARPFVENLASSAIMEHLQALGEGRIKRLLVAVSPGIGKSTLCSVLFPAWMWARRPAWRAIFASYAHGLAVRDSLRTRRLVTDDWYRARFATDWSLREDQNRNDDFENTKSGRRLAAGVGGMLTGSRANHATVDDSLNAVDAHSLAIRTATNDWFDQALSTRLDDPDNATTLVIQQRLHEADLVGHLLEKGGWEMLILPSLFESKRRCVTSIWQDPRTEENEPLAPEIDSRAFLERQKHALGSYGFAGQYQQLPAPAEGGAFKRDWFKTFDELPKLEDIVISVDCAAKKTEMGSNTAAIVIGRKGPWRYVIDCFAGHITTAETGTLIREMQKKHGVFKVLVEQKAAGFSVIEELKNGIPGKPETAIGGVIEDESTAAGDNYISRAMAIQPQVEVGNVMLKRGAPWVEAFLHEICTWPNGAKDDRVDAFAQAMNYFRPSSDFIVGMNMAKW